MPEKLSREIRKLEVRLESYLGEEESFVKELRKCIDKFTALNKNLEELKNRGWSKRNQRIDETSAGNHQSAQRGAEKGKQG